MEILENIDKLMNKLDSKYYSRLLGNLAWIIHAFDVEGEGAKLMVLNNLDGTDYPEEETAIIQRFIDHPNIRPVVLASVYSRVIMTNFRVNHLI